MVDNNIKIALLTTINNPLLPWYIDAMVDAGVKDFVCICDSKLLSAKNIKIITDRTNGVLAQKSIYDLKLNRIPFHFVESHNGCESIKLINDLNVKSILNAGTPRKLTSEIINAVEHGIVNIHPGVLPAYRGCSAVEWSIFNDDRIGNTAHLMTSEYDEGPIIKIEEYKFMADVSYPDIRASVYKFGAILAAEVMKKIQEGLLTKSQYVKQDEACAKYWPPIGEREMEIVLRKRNSLFPIKKCTA